MNENNVKEIVCGYHVVWLIVETLSTAYSKLFNHPLLYVYLLIISINFSVHTILSIQIIERKCIPAIIHIIYMIVSTSLYSYLMYVENIYNLDGSMVVFYTMLFNIRNILSVIIKFCIENL